MINCKKLKMIGVDVSKLKLDIAIDEKKHFTLDNQENRFPKYSGSKYSGSE